MKLTEINWNNFKNNYDVFKYKYEHPQSVVESFLCNEWVEYKDSEIPCLSFLNNTKYRIKPEPQYRPYTEVKEEWYLKKVKRIDYSYVSGITDMDFTNNALLIMNKWYNLSDMLDWYIWGNNGDENDGKPFGELVKWN